MKNWDKLIADYKALMERQASCGAHNMRFVVEDSCWEIFVCSKCAYVDARPTGIVIDGANPAPVALLGPGE